MAWMRLEVSYIDHPKFVDLSDGAFRLWHEGKSYCEKHLTDGLIPATAAKRFPSFSAQRLRELQSAVPPYTAPLWEVHDLGFKMHDYLDHNDNREVALARMSKSKDEKARKRQNQQEYRERKQAERNRSRDRSRDGHVNGNGGGDRAVTVTDKEEKRTTSSSSPTPSPSIFLEERVRALPRGGVLAGALPRDHRTHVFCGRKCVPDFLHAEFVRGLGGDPADAAGVLYGVAGSKPGWYSSVDDALPSGPIGDDPLKFWRAQFAAAFPSGVAGVVPANRAPEFYEWNCSHTPRCPHRAACAIVSARPGASA